jgi:hypothetical protein
MAIEICKHCGREVEVFEIRGIRPWHKIIDGVCCFCLFNETKTKEILRLNIKPDGTAFELINRLIERISIPREQLYWFITNNQSARTYLGLDMNYWHKDCMDDRPTLEPVKVLQRMILLRKMEDLNKPWSEEEYIELKKEYEDALKKE